MGGTKGDGSTDRLRSHLDFLKLPILAINIITNINIETTKFQDKG